MWHDDPFSQRTKVLTKEQWAVGVKVGEGAGQKLKKEGIGNIEGRDLHKIGWVRNPLPIGTFFYPPQMKME